MGLSSGAFLFFFKDAVRFFLPFFFVVGLELFCGMRDVVFWGKDDV